MIAMEADDKESIERNVRQVLTNCTLTKGINIDKLPVIDIEYYFINLRARSVGEVVENNYICTNTVNDVQCGNKMETSFNLLEIGVDIDPENKDTIQLSENITIKLKYPEYSLIEKINKKESAVDIAFDIIVDSIEYIYDGEQYYHAKDSTKQELMEFIEALSQSQFAKLENFFDHMPKIRKTLEVKCKKCGFDHSIAIEGLENFFG
jgi:hypothetical protein